MQERLRLHNEHIFPTSYTARFDGLWNLIYTEEVETKSEALKRERQLKSYRGRYFLRQFIQNQKDSNEHRH